MTTASGNLFGVSLNETSTSEESDSGQPGKDSAVTFSLF
jgi:hypothetical protein